MTATTQRPRFVRFNPEINTGNILTILTLAIGIFTAYNQLDKQQASQAKDIESLRAKDVEMTTRGNERYADLKLELRELKASTSADNRDLKAAVADLAAGINIMRGRAAETSPRTPTVTR